MEHEQMNDRGFIKGEIMFIIFENESEHFSIAKIKIHETNENYSEKEIVGKGHFSNLQPGVAYQFFGNLDMHPKFGMQYNITAYQTFVPETKEAVVAYLSSDLFFGIGKRTAESIVQKLGDRAIDKILDDPNVLFSVPHMRKKTIETFIQTLQENQGFEKVAVQLTRFGISLKMAQKLYETYKEETMSILKENPYQFVFDIENFGFLTADKIAEINGLSRTDENRLRASCIYALQLSVLDGHVYLPLDKCLNRMQDILKNPSLEDIQLVKCLEYLTAEKNIIIKNENVYFPSLYYAEDQFSSHIKRIMEKEVQTKTTDADLMEMIGEIEEEDFLSYGEEQFIAIKQAIHSKLMIL